jgi:hypothetical protein
MPQLSFITTTRFIKVTAKALAEGNGYRIESLPLQPYQTKYPPLYEASPATLFYTDYLGFYRNDVTLAGLPDLLFSNSNLTFKAIGELFIFDSDDGIGAVTIARVVTLAVIAGCVRLVRNGRMVHYTAFAAAYAGQFLVWNYPPTHRFLLPLLPLLAAGVWRELRTLPGIVATGFRKRGVERATALAICGLIGFFGWQSARWSVYGLTVLLPQMFGQRQELDWQREPRLPSM